MDTQKAVPGGMTLAIPLGTRCSLLHILMVFRWNTVRQERKRRNHFPVQPLSGTNQRLSCNLAGRHARRSTSRQGRPEHWHSPDQLL